MNEKDNLWHNKYQQCGNDGDSGPPEFTLVEIRALQAMVTPIAEMYGTLRQLGDVTNDELRNYLTMKRYI